MYGLQVGETFQFNVTFLVPPEGYEIVEMVDTSVSYPSGDPVISVSPTGLITAIGPGIGFDTTSRLITAREPGVATLTAIVSYGLPGSSESRQIELSSVVGVATVAC